MAENYLFIAISFYRNIEHKNIVCDMGLKFNYFLELSLKNINSLFTFFDLHTHIFRSLTNTYKYKPSVNNDHHDFLFNPLKQFLHDSYLRTKTDHLSTTTIDLLTLTIDI